MYVCTNMCTYMCLCMYMFVCMSTFLYECMCTQVHMRICICLHTCAYVSVCMYNHVSVCVQICAQKYGCACVLTCVYLCMYMYTSVCAWTFIHTFTHIAYTHGHMPAIHMCTHLHIHMVTCTKQLTHICTPMHTHIHMSCVHTHAYTCHVCTHILVQTDVSQTELVICLCRIQLNSPLPGEQVCTFLPCQLRMRARCSWKNLSWNALWFCRGSRAARGKAIFCRLSRSISCLYLDESC